MDLKQDIKKIESQALVVGQEVRAQSLQALVTGFSFAAAIAWMDVARWIMSTLVKVPRNGGSHYVLTALMTTLIGVVVFNIVARFQGGVKMMPVPLAVAA